jgi:hypothetical protein
MSSTDNTGDKEPFMDMVKRQAGNCWVATMGCCFKAKEDALIQSLQVKLVNRKKKFGVDYVSFTT